MKGVFIKWHRGDRYERKEERKAAIRNAHRAIRQQTRLQLQEFCLPTFNTDDYAVFPCKQYETGTNKSEWGWFDNFVHPRVRLGYFD